MKQAARCDVYRPVTATHRELRRVQARAFVRLRLAMFAVLRTEMEDPKRDTTAELDALRSAVDLYRASHCSDDQVLKASVAAIAAHDCAIRAKTMAAGLAWTDLVRALWAAYLDLESSL
jgi:hypothetical protein